MFPTSMSSFRCRSELSHSLNRCPRLARDDAVLKVLSMTTMLASDLPLPRIGRGKVRDIYAVGDDRVLLLTTDRISAFDVVMAETIPMKGAVLTQISAWWFAQLEGVVHHHMISADADEIIQQVPALEGHRASLAGRAMLCRRTTVFPIECVVRGYISGSAWKEYAAAGHAGRREAPLRPAGERQTGAGDLQPGHQGRNRSRREHHDRAHARGSGRRGGVRTGEHEPRRLYARRKDRPRTGHHHRRHQVRVRPRQGRPHHPDRRGDDPRQFRFWAADAYTPGQPQPSFDKQPLRDYLDVERRAGRWNGDAPPPPLPASVVDATSKRYLEAYRRVTGTDLEIK